MFQRFHPADWLIIFLLGIAAILAVFPFYQTLMLSFSSIRDAGTHRIFLIPSSFDLSSYKYLFLEGKVTSGLLISVAVTATGTVVSMVVSVAGAYALSKKTLPGRNLIFNGIIFTMFFSGGLIPYFLTLQKLHFQNNLLVMILPMAVNAFNLILLKNFFATISPALEESAKIDGANDITILIWVVVPISMPILATMTLFYAVERWNEWWLPMLFINDTRLYPLQLVLRNALTNLSETLGSSTGAQLAGGTQNIYADSVKSAMIMISAIPIICVYPFVQRFFTKGIMIGSIKG